MTFGYHFGGLGAAFGHIFSILSKTGIYKNLKENIGFCRFEEVGRRLLETFWLHFGRLKASWIVFVVSL